MSGNVGESSSRLRHLELLGGNRWTVTTVIFGVLFGAIQVVHTVRMLTFGLSGAILEGVVPLVFAAGIALSGPWLQYNGYSRAEQKRIVGWMAGVSVIAGMLFCGHSATN